MSFRSKHKKIVFVIRNRRIGSDRALAKKQQFRRARSRQELIPRTMHAKINKWPIIQSSSLEVLVVNLEPQRFDQVKRRQSRGTQSGNAPGIRRDFRLE